MFLGVLGEAGVSVGMARTAEVSRESVLAETIGPMEVLRLLAQDGVLGSV